MVVEYEIHSLFYHILTPQSTHYVDFGTTVLNSTVVRSITLENITSKDVVLEKCSSIPSDLQIFVQGNVNSKVSRPGNRREQLLQSIEARTKVKRQNMEKMNSPLAASSTSNLINPQAAHEEEKDASVEFDTPAYLDLACVNEPMSPHRRSQTHFSQLRSLRSQFAKQLTPDFNTYDKSPTSSRGHSTSSLEDVSGSWADITLEDLLSIAEKETGIQIPQFSNSSL